MAKVGTTFFGTTFLLVGTVKGVVGTTLVQLFDRKPRKNKRSSPERAAPEITVKPL